MIEPGVVPTQLLGAGRRVAAGARDPRSPYAGWFAQAEREADALVAQAPLTTDAVAAVVCRALAARRPRLRYVVGRRAAALLWLRQHMPEPWFERIYYGEMLRRVTRPRAPHAGRTS
jgi:hypothetical protein